MKIYNSRPIFDNFNENFAIFKIFFKNFSTFREKIWAQIYKFAFVWVQGRSPEASEITKNLIQKSMVTSYVFGNFHKLRGKI